MPSTRWLPPPVGGVEERMRRFRTGHNVPTLSRIGAAGVIAAALAVAPRAQQTAALAGPKALVPVAASSLASNADAYYGEFVSLTGAVEQILSPAAFSVDQDRTKSTGNDILIVAPTLTAPVTPNTYVTVLGEVARFDPSAVAKLKEVAVDLPPDVVARFAGRPVLFATSVITTAGVDIAKRLPPPLTAEEQAYSSIMKRVGPAFASLRGGVDGANADAARENAATLKKAFAETEAFWKTRGKGDALQFASDARKEAELIERLAAAPNWNEIKTSVTNLNRACQSCHGAYRERLDDGTYRIKTAAR